MQGIPMLTRISVSIVLVTCLLITLLSCSPNPLPPPTGVTEWGLAAEHDDVARLGTLPGSSEQPAWSPNGRLIAFEYMQDRVHQGGIDPDNIYLIEADGTDARALIEGDGQFSCDDPGWAPDSERIVTSCNIDGDYDLYLVDVLDATMHQLTNFAGDEASPAWSPDGTRIAFEWREERNSATEETLRTESRIYLIDTNGDSLVRLTNGPCDHDPAWAPDSERISFSSRADCGSSRSLCITDVLGLSIICYEDVSCLNSAWAPGGGVIACASGLDILGVDAGDGDVATWLHTRSGLMMGLSWSPDGQHIVFSHGQIQQSANDLYILTIRQ